MVSKVCTACGELKPLEEFVKGSHRIDGYINQCKKCIYQRNKDNYKGVTRLRRRRYWQSARGRASHMKVQARQRGIPCNITINQFEEWYNQQAKRCFYCNAWLTLNGTHGTIHSVSIDRLDNMKGYTLGNIILSCRRCNRVKSNTFTAEQMQEIGKKYLWAD